MKNKSEIWYWLTAASLFLIMMFNCGVGYYSLALFVDPIAKTFGISNGDVALLYTFYSVGSAIAALLLHKLLKHITLKKLILFGGMISTLGYIDFVLAPSLKIMFIGGALIGASTVFAGTAAVQLAIARWFEEKRSMVTGIVAAASGVGTAIGSPVVGEIIRNFGWRRAFGVIGALVFLFIVVQVLLLYSDDPERKGLLPYGAKRTAETKMQSVETGGIPLKTAKGRLMFYVFVLGMLATSIIYQTISLYQSSILLERGFSEELAATCLSVFAVVDMISKATAGIVADKKGFHVVTTYCAAAVIAALCLVRVIHTTLGAIAFSALLGFWPTILVLYGVTVSIAMYGKAFLPEYISFSQTVMCCCSMIGLPIIRVLYNTVGSFDIIMNIVLVFAAVFLVLMLYLLRPKNLYQENQTQKR